MDNKDLSNINSSDKFLVYGAQAVGCIGGVLSIAMGVYNCVTFRANCFIAGILLGIFGFIVVAFEAPYCCLMFEFTDKLYIFSQRLSPILKAVAYIVVAIIPLILCATSISMWVACALMAGCGILYGIIALRRGSDCCSGDTAAGSNDTEMNNSRTNLVDKN